MRNLMGQLQSYLKRLIVALGITMLFMLLSTFPNFGYFANARVTVEWKDVYGFLYVCADCNIVYNPFLYPLSWLTGNGQFSGTYRFVSMPEYVASGSFMRPRRKLPTELGEEAIMSLVFNHINLNTLFNLIIILAVKLAKMQDLYFCLIAGMIGFAIGGLMGALYGFLVASSTIAFVMLRLKRGNGIAAWILVNVFK